MEKMSFAAACVKVGLKMPGEAVGAFGAQLKQLTEADHAWFKERFAIEYELEIVRPNI